ncbi:hypothetical protein MRB53_040791 [Persea americana]|nr:hypothetical protein MRB53_040791 [Persea americana]
MESLDNTEWDVVISGTGLKAVTARFNRYYGGNEAAFSLTEAEEWAEQHSSTSNTTFTNAVIQKHDEQKLGSSRHYSISLAPHLIYARSDLLDGLVSSKVHDQLDVLAVVSWSVLERGGEKCKHLKVPNGREDIFQDSSFDLKAKRALMKFIRVTGDPSSEEQIQDIQSKSITQYLEEKFGLPKTMHAAILALTMSPVPARDVTIEKALPNVKRHLQSIGRFGAFAALTPKWGGLAEIAQVACRAQAVNGGTYVLDCGVEEVDTQDEELVVQLSRKDKVKAKMLVGNDPLSKNASSQVYSRGVYIVSASLDLFPLTAEGGVKSAGAVIYVHGSNDEEPPVQILAHSSDTGILYASIAMGKQHGYSTLQSAVQDLFSTINTDATILWSMQYEQRQNTYTSTHDNIIPIHDIEPTFVFENKELEEVRQVWKRITGEDEETFLKFEARERVDDNDDDY